LLVMSFYIGSACQQRQKWYRSKSMLDTDSAV
jgi:hypothetical protein